MNGKTMWEIGRALNSPSREGLRELMEKHPDFIQKWGSRCKTINKAVPERFKRFGARRHRGCASDLSLW